MISSLSSEVKGYCCCSYTINRPFCSNKKWMVCYFIVVHNNATEITQLFYNDHLHLNNFEALTWSFWATHGVVGFPLIFKKLSNEGSCFLFALPLPGYNYDDTSLPPLNVSLIKWPCIFSSWFPMLKNSWLVWNRCYSFSLMDSQMVRQSAQSGHVSLIEYSNF